MLAESVPEDSEQCLIDLFETYRSLSKKNLLETYHDAQQALDSALNLFSLGYLPLEQRSLAENFYWAICRKILQAGEGTRLLPGRTGRTRGHARPIRTSATSRCSRACRTVGR